MSNERRDGDPNPGAIADEWAAAMADQPPNGTVATEVVPAERPGTGQPLFPNLSGANPGDGGPRDIELILDIPVQLTVELGRTRIPIKHILQLAQGSVVELEALAGEPMDVLINGCLIAQGEVVVVNDKFGIRLTDIVTPSERVRRLSRT
jgi:flagellar motor switch protein FliN/FliY